RTGMPAQSKVTKRSSPQHSVPRYGSACPQSASDLGGRFQIKIKSTDQKTADFVIEKDVRATATAKPYSD
ncbi:hypothetical protein, partial [Salmonella enterica]|uniref:hypothetical protein n=1 Tax=Salmonella enterica TaxID=28901 RepID=UPI0022B729FC